MQIEDLYQLFLLNPQVETDSRKINPGDIFFALKGPNYNGNHFCKQALQAGAAYCVTDEIDPLQDDRIIIVPDSLETLQQLAKKHRQQFSIPFIAITGSNGKTTTKELIHQVLSTEYVCYTTEGNLNNHIGIPLTILRVQKNAEIAVIEMGANHQHEIEAYCEYTLPTHGIITNVGKAHLEGFGGEKGVLKGKAELFDYLRKTKGTAFVNNDYAYLKQLTPGIESVITYGSTDAEFIGNIINESDFLEVNISKGASIPSIKTRLIGNYNCPNIITAVCVGKTFGVADKNIKLALENYSPVNSRSQLIERNSNTIILDAYNANPSSMRVAIENFAKMKGSQKVLILGSMMELGIESENEHAEVVRLITTYEWHKVVLVGLYDKLPVGFIHFNTSAEVTEWIKKQGYKNTRFLVKGSRGMKMEKVLEGF
ncbi:MAG: UDP-N-acetylmuramoyl-tripeptide--D-alanyl-D-alanine ligase [Ferruginibacter sp.]